MPSGDELRALVLADLDVLHHRLKLRFVDHRAHFGFRVKSVA